VHLLVLTSAGIVLSAACWRLARLPNLVLAPRAFLVLFTLAFLAYACGALAAFRLRSRRGVAVILTVGVVTRLLLLPTSPTLSTDAYRYVWDARVASAGIDPYAYPPAAPEVAGLRDASIYPRLNHTTWRTVYPPPAQAFFRAVYWVAPDSVAAMKLALGVAELLAMAALVLLLRTLDLPPGRLAIYAWHPLVLVEIWGSGHLDAGARGGHRRRPGVSTAARWSLRPPDRHRHPREALPRGAVPAASGRRRAWVAAAFASVVVGGTVQPEVCAGRPPIGRYARDEFQSWPVRSLVNEPLLRGGDRRLGGGSRGGGTTPASPHAPCPWSPAFWCSHRTCSRGMRSGSSRSWR
jgi:hypothetical protein